MEEGTILTWLKQDGARIEAGEDLVEIETDKATVTHAAQASGILSIIADEGMTLEVGAPIARVGDRTEAQIPDGDEPEPAAVVAADSSNGRTQTTDSDEGVKATPVARRVAKAHGVSLENIIGTGPLGRVTRGDVLAKAGLSAESRVAPVAARPAATTQRPADASRGDVESVGLSNVQATIASRMTEIKATVPDFQVETEVVMDEAVSLRARFLETGVSVPSLNDLIVKASALALRKYPRANGAYRNERFELYSRVNIGIAVATDDALVVPTVFDADQKSLGTIAAESRRLAEQVRDRTIAPTALTGATFTVSNLGMYGMTAITPVINAGQAAILGVGTIRVVLARGIGTEIADRHLMTLRLTCDHRILYGADAAQFLSEIRELLEQPLRLVL
jgi:pyruvate dehydrogenase E2 component (dihydrolipoamide acetyltransferase)